MKRLFTSFQLTFLIASVFIFHDASITKAQTNIKIPETSCVCSDCYGIWQYVEGESKGKDGKVNKNSARDTSYIEIRKDDLKLEDDYIADVYYNISAKSEYVRDKKYYILARPEWNNFCPDFENFIKKWDYNNYFDKTKSRTMIPASAISYFHGMPDPLKYTDICFMAPDKHNPNWFVWFNCDTGIWGLISWASDYVYVKYVKFVKSGEKIYKEKDFSEPGIKAITQFNEIKPDGSSKLNIEAYLFSYTPGRNEAEKPKPNKKIKFIIEQQSGITPGVLSTSEGVTDANGKAYVTFTAPQPELINGKNILSATVKVYSEEYNIEDIAYINFNVSKGDVTVEPNVKGVVSEYGIVPLDNRYPALIKAKIRDMDGKLQVNKKVTFTISGNNTYGILKTSEGQSGKSVSTNTDSKGFAEVLFTYSSGNPEGNVMETIDIKADGMSSTEHAYVYLGFNLIAEKVVNKYEGKGVINAGEEVPILIQVKDSRYKDLDLQNALSYWGLGGNTGSNRLSLKLDIEPTGTLPDYLMERLQLMKEEQPKFSDEVDIKSFPENKNVLYVKESSLLSYRGFPKIKPIVSGQTNYEVKLSLVDNSGSTVTGNNSNPAIISIKTGLPADATTIFISENPFGPNTDQAIFVRTVLDLAGFGTYLAVNDAIFSINKGDFVGVVGIVLGELKGKLLDLGKEIPGLTGEIIKIYTELATTEKYASLAFGPGPLQQMEDAVIAKIASTMTRGTSKIVVLHGDGSQFLTDSKGNPIPIQENTYTHDKDLNTITLKHGSVSVYLLPDNLSYKYQNASKCKEYGKSGNNVNNEKPKEKEKTKEKETKTDYFSGKWETGEFGTVSFTISGKNVIGTCSKNLGGMTGSLSSDGKKVTGTWARFPTYSSPNDAGLFDFTISADGKSFTGFYSKGTDVKAKLDKSITGKKK